MVPLVVDVFQVDVVVEHGAFVRVVEALNHGDDGALAAARLATDGDDTLFVLVERHVDAFEHLEVALAGVGELDVFDAQLASDGLLGQFVAALGVDLGLVLQNVDDHVRGAWDAHDVSEDLGHLARVRQKHQHVHKEGGDGSRRDLALLVHESRHVDHGGHGAVHEDLDRSSKESLPSGFKNASSIHQAIVNLELVSLEIFSAESLDSANI